MNGCVRCGRREAEESSQLLICWRCRLSDCPPLRQAVEHLHRAVKERHTGLMVNPDSPVAQMLIMDCLLAEIELVCGPGAVPKQFEQVFGIWSLWCEGVDGTWLPVPAPIPVRGD